MQLKNGLRKILKICYRNGFFKLCPDGNSLITIQYGPLGSLLRRNVWREWLSSIINNVDVNMLPIEIGHSENHLKRLSDNLASSYVPDVFESYFKAVSFLKTHGCPLGFAAYGTGLDWDQTTVNSENCNLFLRKLESTYGLYIVFFCPFKKSSDWFHYWATYRHRWWRKFSSIPSKFSMSEVIETERKDQQISLLMEFPWGQENIEIVTLHNDNFFKNTCHALSKPMEDLNAAVITCKSELNLASFAYLSNSFAEKWRSGQTRRLLQLHNKLTPYKVSISIRKGILNNLKSLFNVAKHLEKELKKHQIAVYPYWDNSIEDETLQFSRNDEMGVPYIIVLGSNALHSGIAHLRNRDTTLEEQVHITELTPKLLKYLQMKSLGVDEF